jgi:glycosyltransferase involved in cell wall biosynthesis
MSPARIYVLCPDYNVPSGGIRKLYRHVDVLNQHGVRASILHQQDGFRCTWFANETQVVYAGHTSISSEDYLVVPEIYGPRIAAMAPGVRKVIFNQNAYMTFRGYSLQPHDLQTPYTSPEVVAALVVSEDNRDYLTYAFPQLRVLRLRYAIDPELFAFQPHKKRQIAFMPRKNPEDVVQVINLLKFRGVLAGYDLIPIDGRSEQEVAAILRDALFFLSFGYPEGCPLPPAEVMACGCIVIGYHGWGGREYLRPEFAYPVAVGDVLAFARTVEQVIGVYGTAHQGLRRKAAAAASFIRQHYSVAYEAQDIVSAWQTILTCP